MAMRLMTRKTENTTAPATPNPGAVRGRIAEIEAQLEQARQAHDAHLAAGQARILQGESPLDIEAEAAGLRGNVQALESALAGLGRTLADAVSAAAGGHLKDYSQAHAASAEALRVLAVAALAAAVAALDPVLEEGARADTRLEAQRQSSNAVLGPDRMGEQFIRPRHLALLDRVGPLRNELERLRFALSH